MLFDITRRALPTRSEGRYIDAGGQNGRDALLALATGQVGGGIALRLISGVVSLYQKVENEMGGLSQFLLF